MSHSKLGNLANCSKSRALSFIGNAEDAVNKVIDGVPMPMSDHDLFAIADLLQYRLMTLPVRGIHVYVMPDPHQYSITVKVFAYGGYKSASYINIVNRTLVYGENIAHESYPISYILHKFDPTLRKVNAATITKQCEKLGIDVNNIQLTDIPKIKALLDKKLFLRDKSAAIDLVCSELNADRNKYSCVYSMLASYNLSAKDVGTKRFELFKKVYKKWDESGRKHRGPFGLKQLLKESGFSF